jgi:hypothetical protein
LSNFGDIEEADVYSAEGQADPASIARRLHETRQELEALRGRSLPDFDILSEEEREVAIKIMIIIVAWLRREGTLR